MECESKKDAQCTTEISRRKSRERSDCRKALSEGREYIVPDDIKIKIETSPESNNTSSEEMPQDDTPAPEAEDLPTANETMDLPSDNETSKNFTNDILEELEINNEIKNQSNQNSNSSTDG